MKAKITLPPVKNISVSNNRLEILQLTPSRMQSTFTVVNIGLPGSAGENSDGSSPSSPASDPLAFYILSKN
jgi:hypothetical protein